MTDSNAMARRFEQDRPHLRAVAQRILGSPDEAEDAVQEAWVRLSRNDTSEVSNLTGWLTTVVSRVCLDMLRTRTSRREDPGDLPEAAAGPADDPESRAVLADSIGPALLLVLDTLAPNERLAFVLHDMFAVSFPEIAEIVGCSPAAARQLASRARRRVRGERVDDAADASRRRAVVEAFLAASRDGDFAGLLALLDPEAELRADAVVARWSGQPRVEGAHGVAETFSGRAQAARLSLIDGLPGAVWWVDDQPRVVVRFTVTDEVVTAIELLGDPDTVTGLRLERLE